MDLIPIRTENFEINGLCGRYIFGLDLFRGERDAPPWKPSERLLRDLSQRAGASLHTGMLLDFADTPEHLFGAPGERVNYDLVNVGISSDSYYSVDRWPHFPPCFFPNADENCWDIFNSSEDVSWSQILSYDVLATYVAPSSATSVGLH